MKKKKLLKNFKARKRGRAAGIVYRYTAATLCQRLTFQAAIPICEGLLFKPNFIEIERAGLGVDVFGRGPGDPPADIGKVFAS